MLNTIKYPISPPVIGQPAPVFTLASNHQQQISLADLKGHPVILYFYPRDCTPGCTQESQDFRDHYAAFTALNTIILGISRDNIASHEKFKKMQNLPFDLLADTESIVCQAYAVIKPKNYYGKTVQGIERSTFLIDSQGILRHEWRKVKVEGHVLEVLGAVESVSVRSQ